MHIEPIYRGIALVVGIWLIDYVLILDTLRGLV